MTNLPQTYGLESEKPISNVNSGLPHALTQSFFKHLKSQAKKRKKYVKEHVSDLDSSTILGIISDDLGEQGVDNGFNLQETALPYKKNLTSLLNLADLDLKTVKNALIEENATIINMSLHPLGKTDKKTYEKFVAPKSIYKYISYRGWNHKAGIDAKAQNSPATGVTAENAAAAVSVVFGTNAALIGIFANSPFAEGRYTGLKESRITIWDKMIGPSNEKGDVLTSQFPPIRFYTLSEYFNWMFGNKTAIHFILRGKSGTNYKNLNTKVLIIDGNPSVLKYLSGKKWHASDLAEAISKKNAEPVIVTPNISDMEAMQFAQFAGARIRYGINTKNFPLEDFLIACRSAKSTKVEEIFTKWANFIYIEGRDAGSNFPDQEICDAGNDIAKSVVISPSAIQAGLIRNLKKAENLIDKYKWEQLCFLRDSAIRNGLDGEVDGLKVKRFAEEMLHIAEEGLEEKERWMLSYPKWVLKTGKNGADRAIEFVEKYKGSKKDAIKELVKSRNIVIK